MNFIDVHVGKRLRALLRNKKDEREAFAKAHDLSDTELEELTAGTRRLQPHEMVELCYALGIDPEELYEGLHLGGGTLPQAESRPLADFVDRRRAARSAR